MPVEENKTVVLDFYRAFDERNIEQAFNALSFDFVAHMVGESKPMSLETFKLFGLEFYSAFGEGRHSFGQVVCSEDTVVTSGIFTATHVGPFQGLPPTGKRIELSVMHIDRVVQGQIVEHWGYGDVFGLMQQLGIVFLPGPKLIPKILTNALSNLLKRPKS